MLWLGSRDNRLPSAPPSFPGNPPGQAVLYDGLAARMLAWSSNLFTMQVLFSPAVAVNVVAVAGWSVNRPLVEFRARGRLGAVWQPWVPMVVDGSTACAELPLLSYSGIEINAQTAASGTTMTFGEILIGEALALPPPVAVGSRLEVPTVRNGDFAVQVGLPRREVDLDWPPQADRTLEQWARTYAGEAGLLVVDGRVIFGRLSHGIEYARGIEHDLYEFGGVTVSELAGGSPW